MYSIETWENRDYYCMKAVFRYFDNSGKTVLNNFTPGKLSAFGNVSDKNITDSRLYRQIVQHFHDEIDSNNVLLHNLALKQHLFLTISIFFDKPHFNGWNQQGERKIKCVRVFKYAWTKEFESSMSVKKLQNKKYLEFHFFNFLLLFKLFFVLYFTLLWIIKIISINLKHLFAFICPKRCQIKLCK